ncbi:alpha/beta fold hydrolase [Salipiger sp.]|uniref:alpha/beta fold hydrolase n=1 Tax=Salipiger sp. TaxID=2078585 RepID=UPI003A97FA13
MPDVKIDETLTLHYELDCFAEPWTKPETILLVHGIGGASEEWFAWVPPLSADYQVLRVDLRGWGRSTVPPLDFPWSMRNFADDLVALMDRLGLEKVHFVGTKLGGRIGLHFAHAHPERLHSLTLVCTPVSIRTIPGDSRALRPTLEGGSESVREWSERTMPERLGEVSAEMLDWWNALYSRSEPSVISGIFDLAWDTEEHEMLPGLSVPVLVIDSDVPKPPVAFRREWQARIPDVELAVVPITTEGRMISASKPAECVAALRSYLQRRAAGTATRAAE